MSFTLHLESSTAPNNQPSHDFEIDFPRPIDLYGRQYEVALQRATMWNSIFNIDVSAFANNTFEFRHPDAVGAYGTYGGTGNVWTTFTFPDGIYTVEQMSAYISQVFLDLGYADPTAGVARPIVLIPNYSTFKVEIKFNTTVGLADFEIRVNSNWQQLLGFSATAYPNGTIIGATTFGDAVADITNGITQWYVDCSVISGTGTYKNNVSSNSLVSFTINTPPSSIFVIEPANMYYIPLERSDYIDKCRITIRDQLGRIQDLQGEPTSFTLHFRPVKNYNKDVE